MAEKRPILEKISWIATILATIIAAISLKECSSSNKREEIVISSFNLGKSFINNSEWDSAIFYFNKYTLENPQDEKGFYNLGISNYNKGNINSAINNFTEALRLKPNDTLALLGRAQTYLSSIDFGKAIIDLDSLLSFDSINISALNMRSVLHLRKGEFSFAETLLKRAIKISPKDPVLNYNFAVCKTHTLKVSEMMGLLLEKKVSFDYYQEFDSTIEYLKSALSYKPKFPEALFTTGRVLLSKQTFYNKYITEGTPKLDEYEEANDYFTAAIKLEKKYPEAYFYRGISKLLQNKIPEAKSDFQLARQQGLGFDTSHYLLSGLSHSTMPYFQNYYFLVTGNEEFKSMIK